MASSRRQFVQMGALAAVAARVGIAESSSEPKLSIREFGYGDVTLAAEALQERQFRATQAVLRGLDEDGLLKPFRVRAGLPAPGPDLGGWYDYVEPSAATDGRGGGVGFCPGHTFGQWLSSYARAYAADRDSVLRAKMVRLLDQYGLTISGDFYANFRFTAYVYEKCNVGMLDCYRYAEIPQAKDLFARTREAAEPHLPPRPLDRDEQRAWRISRGERATEDFCWDESYTLPENLFLATQAGMGDYRAMAKRYLLNRTWFEPLSQNENVLNGHHAYSYCNSLNSGMQAYFDSGDPMYLRAAKNGFRMIAEQSFATGGWGPQEGFGRPGDDRLYRSLASTRDSFETPCGSYAQFKITRALLRTTRDARYGDSMERVMYNTVLGAKPLQSDGHSFYYADFGQNGQKRYHGDKWPCCSGTIGQVTADYRISTYFHDAQGVYVNLYIPSTLRFTAPDGVECQLSQAGEYPLDGSVRFQLRSKRETSFAMRFRVPSWSPRVGLKVNGREASPKIGQGWASVTRRWRNGDRVELSLEMATRLEPIDSDHPELAALVRGPLVLFAIGSDLPAIERRQLLAAKAVRPGVWSVEGSSGPIEMRPFTAIGDETYQTYLKVT